MRLEGIGYRMDVTKIKNIAYNLQTCIFFKSMQRYLYTCMSLPISGTDFKQTHQFNYFDLFQLLYYIKYTVTLIYTCVVVSPWQTIRTTIQVDRFIISTETFDSGARRPTQNQQFYESVRKTNQ